MTVIRAQNNYVCNCKSIIRYYSIISTNTHVYLNSDKTFPSDISLIPLMAYEQEKTFASVNFISNIFGVLILRAKVYSQTILKGSKLLSCMHFH